MKWLLHEKIQLYIYKPSINKGTTHSYSVPTPPTFLFYEPDAVRSGSTKINSPYYGEFTESLC
jgi:hypothetical protein